MSNETDITRHRLTRKQFFRACECLREEQAWAQETRPNIATLAEKLTAMCGFSVTVHNAELVRQSMPFEWKVKNIRNGGGTHSTSKNHRTIVTNLIRVMLLLRDELFPDLEIPQALLDLYQQYNPDSTLPVPLRRKKETPTVFHTPIAVANMINKG